MDANMLYSILLEFVVRHAAAIPVTMGHLIHALFLNLVKQFDPALSTRLHDEPAYRPYTISSVSGGTKVGERFRLHHGQLCYLRITLLDSGALWHALQRCFLEAGPIGLHRRTPSREGHRCPALRSRGVRLPDRHVDVHSVTPRWGNGAC